MNEQQFDSDIFLDLETVDQRQRDNAWKGWVPLAFPGLSVTYFDGTEGRGLVKLIDLGLARIWSILSASQTVTLDPSGVSPAEATFAVIIQQVGVINVTQGSHRAQLSSDDITVLDSLSAFTIESIGMTQTMVCVLPLAKITSDFPQLFELKARRIPGDLGLCRVLRGLLAQIERHHLALSTSERVLVVTAFLNLLVGLPKPEEIDAPRIHWRIRQALSEIDKAIEEPDLDPEGIARKQNISRRRLDQLFADEIGSTLAAQILERRLMHAAADLCDPSQADRQITDIAFGAGFKDSAHFSRAFKRRFDTTPRQWRKSALERSDG